DVLCNSPSARLFLLCSATQGFKRRRGPAIKTSKIAQCTLFEGELAQCLVEWSRMCVLHEASSYRVALVNNFAHCSPSHSTVLQYCLTHTTVPRNFQTPRTKGPHHGHYFDRYRSRRTDDNHCCRIPGPGNPPVAGLRGSPADRKVLGSTNVAGNIHPARCTTRRPFRVSHDGSGWRESWRLLGVRQR